MSSVTTGAAITDFAVTQDSKAVTPSAITTTGSAVTLTVATVEPSDVDQNVVYSVSYKGGAAKTTTLLVPKKVVVDATVTSASDIIIPDVTVGSLAVLPANVNVSLNNNTTTSAAITWEPAATATATYATVGPVVIKGTLAEYGNYPVSANVNVIAALTDVTVVATEFIGNTMVSVTINPADVASVTGVTVNGKDAVENPSLKGEWNVALTGVFEADSLIITVSKAEVVAPDLFVAGSYAKYVAAFGQARVYVKTTSAVTSVTIAGEAAIKNADGFWVSDVKKAIGDTVVVVASNGTATDTTTLTVAE